MGTTYDDLPDHEGHTRPHGRSCLSACSCGWTGTVHHDARDAALEEWNDHHAQPLLQTTVPWHLADQITDLKAALIGLARERPAAARSAIDGLRAWATWALERSAAPMPEAARECPLPDRGLGL
jgi:kynureninase